MFILCCAVVLPLTVHAGRGNDCRDCGRNGSNSARAEAEAEVDVDVRTNVDTNTSAIASPTITIGDVGRVKIPPGAPGIPQSLGETPQIFWGPTLPANALGVEMNLEYLKACKPRYKKDLDTRDIVKKGASGLTSITFSPHANHLTQTNNEPVKEVFVAMPADESSSDKYICLGIIKVEALMKKATDSQLDTLYTDAGEFAVETLRGGYEEVYLVTVPGVIAKNLGVSNRGGGAGFAPAISEIAGDTFRGLGIALSGNKGDTFSVAQLGTTLMVLAKPKKDEQGVEVPTGNLYKIYSRK